MMELHELKDKLSNLELKQYDGMRLGSVTIVDAQKFVDTHISFLEINSGNITYLCYYKRLLQFYNEHKNTKQ